MLLQLLPLLLLQLLFLLPSLGIARNAVQLSPHVPNFIDTSHLHHLNQTRQTHIWFRENTRTGLDNALHASLNLTLHHPTVVLDHSFHTTETCTSTELSIRFFSEKAFHHARAVWATEEKLVFITSKSACARFNTGGHHTYFASSDLDYNEQEHTVRAHGDFLELKDVASHGRIDWGHMVAPPARFSSPVVAATPSRIYSNSANSIASVTTATSPHPKATNLKRLARNTYYDKYCSPLSCFGSVSVPTAQPTVLPTVSPTASGYTIYSVTPVQTPGCQPPAATISGLPAVPYCSSDFDKQLDRAIGVFDLEADDADVVYIFNRIAPGIADDIDNFADHEGLRILNSSTSRRSEMFRRHMEERRWKLFASISRAVASVAKKIARSVASVAVTIAHDVARGAVTAFQAAKSAVKAVINHTFSVTQSHKYSKSLVLKQGAHSPWGDAHLIHQFIPDNAPLVKAYEFEVPPSPEELASNAANGVLNVFARPYARKRDLLPEPPGSNWNASVAIYCVNCGIEASFEWEGHIEFSLLDGITDGQVTFRGELLAELQIGFDAMYQYKKALGKKRLTTLALLGWEIPKVIYVGPLLTIDMQAMLEAKAEGQILAGYALVTNVTSHIDIKHSANSYYTGWNPTIQKSFSVHGELSVGLAFEMPIGLGVGISLFPDWKLFQKHVNLTSLESIVGVVNTPSLHFDASVDVAFEYRTVTSPDGTTIVYTQPLGDISGSKNCPGVKLGISVQDKFIAQVLGGKDSKELWDYTKTLASPCITLWHSPTPTPVVPSTASYTHMGCYRDNLGFGGSKRSLSAKSVGNGNTIETCKAACVGYLYYGLEYSGECYCANSASVGTTAVPTGCDRPCTANTSEICGGYWVLDLYAYEDQALATQATAPGLQYWAWQTYPQLNYTGDYVNVAPIANAKAPYSGVTDGINVFFTSTNWDSLIQLPGQSAYIDSGSLTVILQGFFVPKLSGIYTFTPVTYDNKLLIWTGPLAHTSYISNNTIINQWGWQEDPLPTTLIVEAGHVIPITIMWINWSGPGSFSIRITDPNGTDTMDTRGLFMHDPKASINDGQSDRFVVKRDMSSPTTIAHSAEITTAPDAISLQRGLRRQIAGDTTTTNIVYSTTGIPVVNDWGETGTIFGALTDISNLPDDVDLTVPSAVQPSFPDAEFTWLDPNNSTDSDYFIVSDLLNPTDPSTNFTDSTLEYANIRDVTGTLQLHTGNDSNLYVVSADPDDAAGLYAGLNNVYSGDSQGNVFIYYADEFAALNVSRFRAVPPDAIPITAQLIGLAPIYTDQGYLYVAMDTLGKTMFLAFCNLENSASKLFLVESLEEGLRTLARPELSYILTGGVVTACGPLALQAAGGVDVEL